MADPPDPAGVRRVLSAFADAVSAEYGGAVAVVAGEGWWEFEPACAGSVGVVGRGRPGS